MSDTIHGIKLKLINNIDVFSILILFLILMNITRSYPGESRIFPMFFLYVGMIAIVTEIWIILLPKSYGDTIRAFSEGVVGNISMDETTDRMIKESTGYIRDPKHRTFVAGFVMFGFSIFIYFVGLLISSVIFTIVLSNIFYNNRYKKTLYMTVASIFIVYVLFNQVLGVPVWRGVLINL